MKIKNIIKIAFICFFIIPIHGSCQTKWQGGKITLPKISKEIIAMRKLDQGLRKKYIKLIQNGKKGTKKYEEVRTKITNVDRVHTARMKEIVAQYGWPTFDKVGEKGSNTAWLIVQHADRSPLFQEKCLGLMANALKNNKVNPKYYAYLYDRVQLAKGEKQLFATQSTKNDYTNQTFFQAIEDESNVQKRRDEMDFEMSVEDYAKSLNFDYTIPTVNEAIERDKKFGKSYNENIKKAKEAMLNKTYNDAVKYYSLALYSDGYTKTDDYVEMARAISLANHKDVSWGFYHLLKAAFRGFENINDFDKNKDFKNLKAGNLDAWKNDLIPTIKELNGNQTKK